MRFGVPVGRFVPAKYTQQVVENSDFRKFDDSLRMEPTRSDPILPNFDNYRELWG